MAGQWPAGLRACLVRKHFASHFLGVLGVLSVLVRPLENEIPRGRPVDFQRHSSRAVRQLKAAGNEWRGPVAEVGARPLRGTGALAKTNRTPKTPRNVPGRCEAPEIGEPGHGN